MTFEDIRKEMRDKSKKTDWKKLCDLWELIKSITCFWAKRENRNAGTTAYR